MTQPPERAFNKRSAEEPTGQQPASKMRALPGRSASLHPENAPTAPTPSKPRQLPVELMDDIFSHNIDPHDAAGTLKEIGHWKLSSKNLYRSTEDNFSESKRKEISDTLHDMEPRLNGLPFEGNLSDFQHLLERRAICIPILKSTVRKKIVKSILNSKEFSAIAVENLVLNMEYLDRDDRSAVSEHVFQRHQKFHDADPAVIGLIKQADRLEPEDHKTLFALSCSRPFSEEQRDIRSAWALTLHVLPETEQHEIINSTKDDNNNNNAFMVKLARNARSLTQKSVKAALVESILAMPKGSVARSKGLRHLSKHLDSFDGQATHSAIYSAVRNNLNDIKIANEFYIIDDIEFQAREALYYLSKQNKVLTCDQIKTIELDIENITAAGGNSVKSQFIHKMSAGQRANFVEQQTDFTNNRLTYSVVEIGRRGADLNPDEKSHFIKMISNGASEQGNVFPEHIAAASECAVKTSLTSYDSDQRTSLVRRYMDIAQQQPDLLGDIIRDLASVSRHLKPHDLRHIIDRTSEIMIKKIETASRLDLAELQYSFQQAVRMSFRCVGEWCRQAVLDAQDLSHTERGREEGRGSDRTSGRRQSAVR